MNRGGLGSANPCRNHPLLDHDRVPPVHPGLPPLPASATLPPKVYPFHLPPKEESTSHDTRRGPPDGERQRPGAEAVRGRLSPTPEARYIHLVARGVTTTCPSMRSNRERDVFNMHCLLFCSGPFCHRLGPRMSRLRCWRGAFPQKLAAFLLGQSRIPPAPVGARQPQCDPPACHFRPLRMQGTPYPDDKIISRKILYLNSVQFTLEIG